MAENLLYLQCMPVGPLHQRIFKKIVISRKSTSSPWLCPLGEQGEVLDRPGASLGLVHCNVPLCRGSPSNTSGSLCTISGCRQATSRCCIRRQCIASEGNQNGNDCLHPRQTQLDDQYVKGYYGLVDTSLGECCIIYSMASQYTTVLTNSQG